MMEMELYSYKNTDHLKHHLDFLQLLRFFALSVFNSLLTLFRGYSSVFNVFFVILSGEDSACC